MIYPRVLSSESKGSHKAIEHFGLIGKFFAGRGAFFSGGGVGLYNFGYLADSQVNLIDGIGLPLHGFGHNIHLFGGLPGKSRHIGNGYGNFPDGLAAVG